MKEPLSTPELLRWYIEAGVDETIQNTPVDRYAVARDDRRYAVARDDRRYAVATAPAASAPSPRAAPVTPATAAAPPSRPASYGPGFAEPVTPLSAEAAVHSAVALASSAKTVEDLRQALLRFDGCALKKTATNLVFTDGSPNALVREGWKKEDVKAGDTIKVRCHRLKDGAKGCLLGFVTTKTHIDKEYD